MVDARNIRLLQTHGFLLFLCGDLSGLGLMPAFTGLSRPVLIRPRDGGAWTQAALAPSNEEHPYYQVLTTHGPLRVRALSDDPEDWMCDANLAKVAGEIYAESDPDAPDPAGLHTRIVEDAAAPLTAALARPVTSHPDPASLGTFTISVQPERPRRRPAGPHQRWI